MKIFEFQFNPRAKKDRFFRAFSFEPPEDAPESGNLHIVAELANALPVNASLLDRLAALMSEEYYAAEKRALGASARFKNALKKANDFLSAESKRGNVDWLGNLHFALLLFVPSAQGRTFYFTKIGEIKLWLVRPGLLVDAGKSIDAREKDESSLKTFSNVGSGKLLPQDRIVAVTREAANFLLKVNFLQIAPQFSEQKQFQRFFKSLGKEIALISGVLFLILVLEASKREPYKRGEPQSKISLARLAIPSFLLKISFPALPARDRLRKALRLLPRFSLPRAPNFSAAKNRFSSLMAKEVKKRMTLFALLFLVLLLGFAILRGERDDAGGAREEPLQTELSEELRILHKITEIAEPEILWELGSFQDEERFQRILQLSSRFYFFRPLSPSVLVFDGETNAAEVLDIGANVRFGAPFGNFALFFAEPRTIVAIDARGAAVPYSLSSLSLDARFGAMEEFGGNLYFLDSRNGEIYRSSNPFAGSLSFERWLDPLSPRKPINARSMSIDGNIWILGSEREIQRYYRGVWQEDFEPAIFPPLKEPALLKTNSQTPYFYLAEPAEKRFVILAKSGEVVRQYHSEVFRNIRDFAVSPDGQTLYAFDGAKLYRIFLANL